MKEFPGPLSQLNNLQTKWQGGHGGFQYNRIFSGRSYMKIEFLSQRREMLLFLSTNMAAVPWVGAEGGDSSYERGGDARRLA